jgi:hypothetical protein
LAREIVTWNLKQDMPSVAEARRRLEDQLQTFSREGVTLVKVVHGYGSTGQGGKIKQQLGGILRGLMTRGIVREFVPGERWSTADKTARQLLNDYPVLAGDPDLPRHNPGITIVLLGGSTRKAKPTPAPRAEPAGPVQEDLDRLLETDPEKLYDKYTRPDDIRRLKPDP